MPSQYFSTGPCEIACGVGDGGVLVFLGFSERGIRPRRRRATVKAMSDQGGGVEQDRVYAGQMAMVSCTLTKWHQPTLDLVMDVAREAGGVAVPGTDFPGDVGSLLVEEGKAYPLVFRFTNALKPAYNRADNVMPPGRRYPVAFLDDQDEEEDGYGVRKITLTWVCLREMNLDVVNTFGRGSQVCYDESAAATAGFPSIV